MKQKIFILAGGLLILLMGIGNADLFFTDPVKSGNVKSRFIEVHSYKTCSVVFKNNTNSPVDVDAAKLHINWDQSQVLNGQMNFNNADGRFSTYTPVSEGAGKIGIDMHTDPGAYITVNPGDPLPLVSISFTVVNDENKNGASFGLVWDKVNNNPNPDIKVLAQGNPVPGQILDYISGGHPFGTAPVYIVGSAPPQADKSAVTGISDPKTGNILNLTTSDNAVEDRQVGGKIATTYYDSGAKCRYRIQFYELADPLGPDITSPSLLGNDVPGLSEIQTVANSGHSNLKDGVRYFYKSLAKDDTKNHNEEGMGQFSENADNPVNIIKGVPHDHTPPGAFGFTPTTGDKTFTINISSPQNLDGGTYLVAIKKGKPANNSYGELPKKPGDANWWWNVNKAAVLYNNENQFNGTPADAVADELNKPENSNGWIYVGKGVSSINQETFKSKFPNQEIENGVNYYVAVIACDAASPNQPGSQGYNWHDKWTVSGAKPGVASDELLWFFSITTGEAGSITFDWVNPASVAKGFGGVRIVYTTARDAWAGLTLENGMLAKEYLASDFDASAGAENIKELKTLAQTDPNTPDSPGNLDINTIYYFKAFTFNDPVQRLYSLQGFTDMALPLRGGAGGGFEAITLTTTPEATIELVKLEKGFGINTIVLPFSPATDEDGKGIATLGQLIDKINEVAGKKVVTTAGYWDKNSQITVGFVFDDEGKVKSKKGIDADPDKIHLQPFVGYQIYVTESVPSFKLKGMKYY